MDVICGACGHCCSIMYTSKNDHTPDDFVRKVTRNHEFCGGCLNPYERPGSVTIENFRRIVVPLAINLTKK